MSDSDAESIDLTQIQNRNNNSEINSEYQSFINQFQKQNEDELDDQQKIRKAEEVPGPQQSDSNSQLLSEKNQEQQNQDQDLQIEKINSSFENSQPDEKQKKIVDDDENQGKNQKKQTIQIRKINFKDQQYELFENSLDKNSIIFLPTGVGKTLVSIMAMQYYLAKFGKERKIIFLANTVQLVKQQAEAIKKQLPQISHNERIMSNIRQKLKNNHHQNIVTPQDAKNYVVCLHGQKNEQLGMTKRKMIESNAKEKKEIMEKINKGVIVVMISQMFLNCLRRGYLKLSQCMFIVFDQCHHCHGQHPYKSIIDQFYYNAKKSLQNDQSDQRIPILMGLTASPALSTHDNVDKIKKQIQGLCNNMNSTFSFYSVNDKKKFDSSQQVKIQKIQIDSDNDDQSDIPDLVQFYKTVNSDPKPFELSKRKLKNYLTPLYDLINQFQKKVSEQSRNLTKQVKQLFENALNFLALKSVDVWLELGVYALFKLLQDIHKQFSEHTSDRAQDKSVIEACNEIFIKHLQIFRNLYGKCVTKNFSKKVTTLIEIIQRQQENLQQNEKKILIFVYQRRIVRFLQKIIQDYIQISKMPEKLKDRFKSKCVTGSSDSKKSNRSHDNIEMVENPTQQNSERAIVANEFRHNTRNQMDDYRDYQGINQSLQNERRKRDSKLKKEFGLVSQNHGQQIKTINDFRNKQFPILLTTSVTEQGFNIPHCNTVISFNRPDQLKSFIQIKGRARAKNSKYIILQFSGKYKQMQCLKKKYQSTIQSIGHFALQVLARQGYQPRLPQINPFYKMYQLQSGAIINTNNALQILMGFLNSQRGFSDSIKNKVFSYYFKTPETGYTCYFKFHDGLPIDIVKGQICTNKKDAQKSAAFNAVVDLYKRGYIKPDLRPKNIYDLQGQFQNQKINDFEMMVSDEQFASLMRQFTKVEQDKSTKKPRIHYKSYKSKQFDFQKINPDFSLISFKLKPFNFQLYKINITNNNNIFKLGKGTNSNTQLSIGLLTCFKSCDVSNIFTNFRYKIAPNLNQQYNIQLIQSQMQVSYQKYCELRKIHDFLVCSAQNSEIILMAKKNPPTLKQWKVKLQSKKYQFDDRQFYPLFILLDENKLSKKYQIAESVNQKLLQYQSNLQKIYQFHNNYSKNRMKTQPVKFPINLQSDMIDFRQNYKPDQNGRLLIQSISSDYMLHKCVLMRIDPQKKQLTEAQSKKIAAKKTELAKVYPHSRTADDKLLKVIILRKILTQLITTYLKPENSVVQSLEKQEREIYRSQFMKYPIDMEIFLQLRFCLDFILPKVADYSKAYHFRNVFLRNIEQASLKRFQENDHPVYNFVSPQNIILKNFQSIRNHLLNQNKMDLIQKAKHLIDSSSKYQYPLQSIIEIIAKQGLDKIPDPKDKNEFIPSATVHQLNNNQILRSLTAKSYKPNKTENYEEYEFIGDVVLKMLATIQVFITKPEGDQGQLHISRANIVSNANLRQISIRNKVFQYIMTKSLKEPPAPLKLFYNKSLVLEQEYKTTGVMKVNSASEQQGFCMVSPKTHADVIEALIGVYYLNNSNYNLDQCQFFLYSMNILKNPTLKLNQVVTQSQNEFSQLSIVQDRLLHKFKNKNLLVQAFTHKTFQTIVKDACDKELNKIKNSLQISQLELFMKSEKNVYTSLINRHEFYYERLEFLGDSVLDLVAVQYIYQQTNGQLEEGVFSLKKQVSVSNKTLGLVALFWGLDQFILINSKQTLKEFKNLRDRFSFLYEHPEEIYSKQAAPLKILGDILEAYVGAVFVDSNFDYEHTKAICRRILCPFIDHFTSQQMLKKHPQYTHKKHLKSNNMDDVKVKKTDRGIVNGLFEFVMVDRAGNQIEKCREVSLKKAQDKLLEMYLSKKKGISSKIENDEQQDQYQQTKPQEMSKVQ